MKEARCGSSLSGRVPSALPTQNQLIAREELFKVGVDSGQAACSTSRYRAGADAGQISSEDALEAWYNSCCNQTLHTDHYAGVIPHGVVSNSAWGWRLYLLLLPFKHRAGYHMRRHDQF